AVVIGMLGLATVLPVRNGELGGDALRALRAASWAALVLAGAAATVHLLTLSDLVGRPLGEALAGQAFTSYTGSVIQGQAYAAVFVLALTIVPAARLTVGHGGAIALLCLGIGTLVPLGLIGHSSSGDYHHSATISLLVHLIAMALWVGGLIAVAWYAGRRGRELPRAARAFSAVALGCFVLVGASGVVNAWVRFNSITEVFTTSYGLIMFGKIVALVALGVVGYMHRNRTLPVLEAGRRGAFRRLAAGEIVIMGAAVGLAVALSRSQPPVPDTPAVLTPARDLLGYPLPPEFSVSRIFTEIYPDALFSIGCLCAFLLYAGGVWRLHRRGDRWPVGRTIAWMSGIAIVAFAGLSGLQTYGMTMMSVHMVQHMTLMMVCPILLVLGGPITHALRAIEPARRGDIGPREIILAVLNSRVVRVLTNPLVALTLFATGSFMVYFSGLFEAAMREHTGHLLMSMHFLLVGYLFFEILIGIDPLPKRPPYPARVVVHLLAV